MSTIDPKKRAKIVELAKTGLYSRTDILKKIFSQFGTINNETFNKILKEEKIVLPKGFAKSATKQSADKSKYLKNYTFDNLETDIKAGKSRVEIVDEILKKNPSDVKNVRQLTLSALGSRISKRPDLAKLEFTNQKNLTKNKKTALKDLKDFVNKNKEAYKKVYASNKVGAVSGFKEKVLDFISEKYPKLINRSTGGRDILTGQRIFTGFDLLGRDVTKKGEYGRDLELSKTIRKSLGIPERPLKGEGASIERLNRTYNKNLNNLLKEAQKQGKVPLIDPQTGFKINSGDAYSRYIDRKNIDPVRNLFGKYFKFGTEHMGGIARASLINDVDSLNQVVALDTFTNKFDKGATVDKKVTTLLNLAKQSSGNKAKDYLETANKLLKESDARYGLDSTKYKLVKNEIVPIQPNEENIFKRAVTAFAATERYKDPNFKLLDPDLKKSIMAFKKGNEETGSKFLKTAVQTLISKTENLSKADQLRFCSLLANGGLPGDCKQALKADPEKAAKILSEAPVTSAAMKDVKSNAQKMIRLFRGEPFTPRTAKSVKALSERFNVSEAEAGRRVLQGQFFSANPDMARTYTTGPFGKMKYVDVTPKEFQDMKRYVGRINKTNDVGGKTRFPVSRKNDGNNIQIVPRRKLKQFEETGRMKSKLNILGDVDTPAGMLKYDSVVGGFIDPADPTKIVDQAQIKTWAQDNPMPVRVGEEPLKVATNKSVLKNVGRTLATIGAPLPTALIDGYFINEQVKEGKGTAEIASNPLNWLGLATMSTLSDISGVSKPGKLNTALRLGLNPGTIRGISRFAGLPGLAVSTAMTAYDQYKKYQNEEGFIYNLFNKEEK